MNVAPRMLEPTDALHYVRELVNAKGDEKVLHSFYLEYGRRLFTLQLIRETCPQHGCTIVDLGASPFILSCALKYMGYRVIAVDYDPAEYAALASQCGVEVVKANLERDRLSLPDEYADCVVLTEVLEHLNPYYISYAMSEINRVLKLGGSLVLTTPNIASLFRRLRLLLGIQPQYATHVREYTKMEARALLKKHGFRALKIEYSEINDLTYIDAKPEEYLRLSSYLDLVKLVMRKPTKLNILRLLAYPLVKIVPNMRMLIVAVAEKETYARSSETVRW